MTMQLRLGDVEVDVLFKDIKNIHLSVHPPTGRVRISAPTGTQVDALRAFAATKLGWIRKQQRAIQSQPRDTRRDFIARESHYVWGRRYLLKIVEGSRAQGVELQPRHMILHVHPGADRDKREAIIEDWYRTQVREEATLLIEKWQQRLGVEVQKLFVQRMKTRWGGCNHDKRHIRLNTELARKPPHCLNYIVLHEMAHLLDPTHGDHFVALMDLHMPSWHERREELNQLPVRHEDWAY